MRSFGVSVLAMATGMAMASSVALATKAGARRVFPPTVLESETPRWTGDPVSVSLKDADIRDVLRTFAVLTGLNVVVDPTVSGSVTVELHDVPWDQAFEVILSLHGLGYQWAGNVMYVAPMGKLARQPLRPSAR